MDVLQLLFLSQSVTPSIILVNDEKTKAVCYDCFVISNRTAVTQNTKSD